MKVVTGDLLQLSYILQRATLGINEAPLFQELRHQGLKISGRRGAETVLEYLQNLPGQSGYLHENFSDAGEAGRLFFTAGNAAKIDAIRTTISCWKNNGMLSGSEEAFLLASLVDAADRVANTAGTYYAHLKNFTRRALLPLKLRMPSTTPNGKSGGCHRADAAVVAATTETDILYLDPPYNERDYSGYYHLPETLVSGDAPLPAGRSGVPKRNQATSSFYRRAQAGPALAQICSVAPARHIVVHYTTAGAIPHEAILDSLAIRGSVSFEDREVRAYSSRTGQNDLTARHRLYWCRVTNGVN